jgi:hypothetical protein
MSSPQFVDERSFRGTDKAVGVGAGKAVQDVGLDGMGLAVDVQLR